MAATPVLNVGVVVMPDRDTRTEAAFVGVGGLVDWDDDVVRDLYRDVLAAADADDRENGIVRVKLDGVFATPGGFSYLSNLLKDSPTPTTLQAVADALREAARADGCLKLAVEEV